MDRTVLPEPKQKVKKKESKTVIPAQLLEQFLSERVTLGEAAKVHNIDTINVYDNFWRINVWTKTEDPNRITCSYNIVKSFFVKLTSKNIIDLTKGK